jgi:DNA-binding transcriptional ArsR family regulator
LLVTSFEVLAEPTRRKILGELAGGELPVSELVRRLQITQPAASKHLRILREAGMVSARVDAQRRQYRIEPAPLAEVDEWLAHFRPFWTKRLDALEAKLDEED